MLEELKLECCLANKRLCELGIVDLTFGNVSVADRSRGILAIKPSGVEYGDLTPESIPLIDFEGNHIEGEFSPSSDTPTHVRLYQSFSDIQSVVHTHSRYATAFAQAGKPIPCLGTTHADYFHGGVPVTRAMTSDEIRGEYEWETGGVIVERFKNLDPSSINAVLVRWHGPFVWGTCSGKAVETAFALEVIAEMAFSSLLLTPDPQPVPENLHNKHFLRKHGPESYYGQREGNLL